MSKEIIKMAIEYLVDEVFDDPCDWEKKDIEELITTCKELGVNFWSIARTDYDKKRVRAILKGATMSDIMDMNIKRQKKIEAKILKVKQGMKWQKQGL